MATKAKQELGHSACGSASCEPGNWEVFALSQPLVGHIIPSCLCFPPPLNINLRLIMAWN